MRERLIIGSRASNLAMTQSRQVAEMIREASPGIEVEITVFSTKGDRVLDKPLAEIGGKGLFTEELEAALREGTIDLAVHSLKDLPTDEPDGLTIAATPERVTPNDALICTKYSSLRDLPAGATVGTSSLRRKAQLLALNPKLVIRDIRGNIETRMGKVLETAELDAVILAAAGLERVNRQEVITEVIAPELMLPAAAQGVLGVQTREIDAELREVLAKIHDATSHAEALAERTLLAGLGGGCQVPIGALAKIEDGVLTLLGCVASLDGSRVLRTDISGTPEMAEILGKQAAIALMDQGADSIIAEII